MSASDFNLERCEKDKVSSMKPEVAFREVLEADPEHAAVLNYLGYMLADMGVRLEEARDYIQKALEKDPYNGSYLDSLGWVYFKLDDLELAEKNLVLASQINDADPTILEHLGDLYYKLGDLNKARQYYEQSVHFAEEEDEKVKVEEETSRSSEGTFQVQLARAIIGMKTLLNESAFRSCPVRA